MTNTTRDSRLALLPEETNEFYPLSDFSKQFTNFKDSFRSDDREISGTFKIHMQHSNAFDFLPVFKFAKSEGIGRNLRIIFSVTCQKTTQKFLPQKKNITKKKLEILHILLTRQDNLNF